MNLDMDGYQSLNYVGVDNEKGVEAYRRRLPVGGENMPPVDSAHWAARADACKVELDKMGNEVGVECDSELDEGTQRANSEQEDYLVHTGKRSQADHDRSVMVLGAASTLVGDGWMSKLVEDLEDGHGWLGSGFALRRQLSAVLLISRSFVKVFESRQGRFAALGR